MLRAAVFLLTAILHCGRVLSYCRKKAPERGQNRQDIIALQDRRKIMRKMITWILTGTAAVLMAAAVRGLQHGLC